MLKSQSPLFGSSKYTIPIWFLSALFLWIELTSLKRVGKQHVWLQSAQFLYLLFAAPWQRRLQEEAVVQPHIQLHGHIFLRFSCFTHYNSRSKAWHGNSMVHGITIVVYDSSFLKPPYFQNITQVGQYQWTHFEGSTQCMAIIVNLCKNNWHIYGKVKEITHTQKNTK